MKQITLIVVLVILSSAFAVAGCVSSPAPTPAPTVTPNPTVTAPPNPTLIGGNDEAHVQFNYQLGSASEYDGQKTTPGNMFYMLQARITTDKPVQTSPDWFWLEYKKNDTDQVQSRQPFSTYMFKYPTGVIGPETGPVKGGLIFELPAGLAVGYPKPYYYMPLADQQGPYKVYDKVYGTTGDVS